MGAWDKSKDQGYRVHQISRRCRIILPNSLRKEPTAGISTDSGCFQSFLPVAAWVCVAVKQRLSIRNPRLSFWLKFDWHAYHEVHLLRDHHERLEALWR